MSARLSGLSAVLLGLLGLGLPGCSHDDLPVATNVDLQRFEGKWYEVAHLPRPTQRDCSGTTATYTRQTDGTFAFAHECTLKDGSYYGKTMIASVPDSKSPAKLAIDVGGFKGDYWILEVAPDYRYAVIGHPSRDYLWILSRSQTLAPADQEHVLASAKDTGFDTTRLEYTAAAPPPDGTPPPPVTTGVSGCSAGTSHPSNDLAGGAILCALAGVLVPRLGRRRRA